MKEWEERNQWVLVLMWGALLTFSLVTDHHVAFVVVEAIAFDANMDRWIMGWDLE